MDDSSTILLVEDNPNDAEVILGARRGQRLAKQALVVRDGEEALDYFYRRVAHLTREAENPKLILLELKHPKLDRLEVLQQIKADPSLKTTPVVMLTLSREEQDLINSNEHGTNACVVKPMSFRVAVETIKGVGLFWKFVNQLPSNAELVL